MYIINSMLIYLICLTILVLLERWDKYKNLSDTKRHIITGVIIGVFCCITGNTGALISPAACQFLGLGLMLLAALYYGKTTAYTAGSISILNMIIFFNIMGYQEYLLSTIIPAIAVLILIWFVEKLVSKDYISFLNTAIVLSLLCNCFLLIAMVMTSDNEQIMDVVYFAYSDITRLCLCTTILTVVGFVYRNIMTIKLQNKSIKEFVVQKVNAISGNVSSTFRGITFSIIFIIFCSIFIFSALMNYQTDFVEQRASCLNTLNSYCDLIKDGNVDTAIFTENNKYTVEHLQNGKNGQVDINLNGYATLIYDDNDKLIGFEDAGSEFVEPSTQFGEEYYNIVPITNSFNNNTQEYFMYMYKTCNNYKIVAFGLERLYMFFAYFFNLCLLVFLVIGYTLTTLALDLIFKRFVVRNLGLIAKTLEYIIAGKDWNSTKIKATNEFHEIWHSIEVAHKQSLDKIEKETKRYAADFELAEQIQQNSLPHTFPPFPQHREIDIYAMYKSAQKVGGDYYDYYFITKNHLAFLIADVSGKGISAAMFMMRSKMAFMAYSETLKNPKAIVEAVNDYLSNTNDVKMFVTCWFGLLDISNGHLRYVNAGHESPFLLRQNSHIKTLPNSGGIVLGFEDDYNFDMLETTLQAGDALYLFTDGLTEAHNKNNELYGKRRLKKCLANCVDDFSIKGTCDRTLADVYKFMGNAEQFDDITMLVVQFLGQRFRSYKHGKYYVAEMSCSVQNVSKTSEYFNSICQENGVRSASIFLLDTILDELLSNVMKYSQSTSLDKITATMTFRDEASVANRLIAVKIVDCGIKFNPLEHDNPNTSPSLSDKQLGGVGIHIAKKKANSLDYEYINKRNVLSFTIRY